jgi:hypothetical protein
MMKRIGYKSLVTIALLAAGCAASATAIPQGWKWGENVQPPPPAPAPFTLSSNPSAVPQGWTWGGQSLTTPPQTVASSTAAPAAASVAATAPAVAVSAQPVTSPAPAVEAVTTSNAIAAEPTFVSSAQTPEGGAVVIAAPASGGAVVAAASAPAAPAPATFRSDGYTIVVAQPPASVRTASTCKFKGKAHGHPPIMSETRLPATPETLLYVQQIGPIQRADNGLVYTGALEYPGWDEFH